MIDYKWYTTEILECFLEIDIFGVRDKLYQRELSLAFENLEKCEAILKVIEERGTGE